MQSRLKLGSNKIPRRILAAKVTREGVDESIVGLDYDVRVHHSLLSRVEAPIHRATNMEMEKKHGLYFARLVQSIDVNSNAAVEAQHLVVLVIHHPILCAQV